MDLKPLAPILRQRELLPPDLEVLKPTESNYRAVLMQPMGRILADESGVSNKDRDAAVAQFREFIGLAKDSHLALTPEYSMPWDVLVSALHGNDRPQRNALWAFGCESIKYSELLEIREKIGGDVELIFESLTPSENQFVDPLVYVFWSQCNGCDDYRLVLVVQFKTFPMGDDDHFELNGMQRGSAVYVFGQQGVEVRLSTLLCSDVFAFTDEHARELSDRTLLLHLQLNPKPRQSQYRAYRDSFFRYGGGETELLCLNWAGDVEEWGTEGKSKDWKNISGSAWYLQNHKSFDKRDSTLVDNHRRGLYYTWFESIRSHVLFFNYQPAVFSVTASKVFHRGVPGSVSRRRGPLLSLVHVWNAQTCTWEVKEALEDGFVSLADGCSAKVVNVGVEDPIGAERIFALASGAISCQRWYEVEKVDAFGIGQSEVLSRVTVSHDTDGAAVSFRSARVRRVARLASIIDDRTLVPAALNDVAGDWRFEWSSVAPHQNIRGIGTGRRGTVVYMGEDVPINAVQRVKASLSRYLHQASADEDASIEARQRLVVWYRDETGQVRAYDAGRYVMCDRGRESEVDFDRGE